MRFLTIYFLLQISFLGIVLEHFSQSNFSSANHGSWHFYLAPPSPIKTASYGPKW